MTRQWRTERVGSLGGGLNLSRNPVLLAPNEAADELNVDHDDDSVASSGGGIKFNNQVARKPGVLCKPEIGLAPLSIEAGKSVPLRSYGVLPRTEANDIGGDFAKAGTFPAETFHNRRGRSFDFQVSFKLPETEKLYDEEVRGASAPAAGAGDAHIERTFGYDEAMDDTFIILQKGGDRKAPMSWFLGVAKTGDAANLASRRKWFLQTGQLSPESQIVTEQASTYSLVFGWFDAPEYGEELVTRMRYDLADPSNSASGEYSTQALRVLAIPHWIEPGREYHVAVQLSMDSAAITDSSWNEDGYLQVAVSEGLGPVRVYGYSARNLINYSDQIGSSTVPTSAAAGQWQLAANTTAGVTELEGPYGEPVVSILTSSDGLGDRKLTQEHTFPATATGRVWCFSGHFRRGSATGVTLRLEAATTGTHEVVWDWSAGDDHPQIASDVSITSANAIRINDDWWRFFIVYNSTTSDNGDTYTLEFSADGTTPAATDEFIYFTNIQHEELSLTDPLMPKRYEPNGHIRYYLGPTDSPEYLTKYGIRYSGKDAVYVGLGYRMAPWQEGGFIPFGMDSAPLEKGGFCMLDRSDKTPNEIYGTIGGGNYSLQVTHALAGDTFVSLPTHRALVSSRTTWERTAPHASSASDWQGYGAASTLFNAEALRGYRMIFTLDAPAGLRGGALTIDSYTEGGTNNISFLNSDYVGNELATFTAEEVLIQALRWNQRPLVISEIRFYGIEQTPTLPTTVAATPDASGSATRSYLPPEAAGADTSANQVLSVFYPLTPRPPGGYPVLMWNESAGFAAGVAKANVVEATNHLEWDLLSRGWVVISVGTVGLSTADTSDPLIGMFGRFNGERWNDYNAHFPEKDFTWARQWVAENAASLGIDNDRVVVSGNSSGAVTGFYACMGADRKQTSGSSQIQQSTRVAAFVGLQNVTWFPIFTGASGVGHWPMAGNPAAKATDYSNADRETMADGSPSRVCREPGAMAATTPYCSVYDEVSSVPLCADLSPNPRPPGGADPNPSCTINSGTNVHAWISGSILWLDMRSVSDAAQAFHDKHSRYMLAPLPRAEDPLDEDYVALGVAPETGIQAHAAVLHWLESEMPPPWPLIPRDFQDYRTQFSLRSEALEDDPLEPGLYALEARYPLDDGGGGVLREVVGGVDGYLAPFQLGLSENGSRGKRQIYLSGEGEALHLDLSENPVFLREFHRHMRSGGGGVAIEITCTFPQAQYGVNEADPDDATKWRSKYAPHIASWEVKDPEQSGAASEPGPLILLSHRFTWPNGTPDAIRRPCGFAVHTTDTSDQGAVPLVQAYNIYSAPNFTFNDDAPWVGRRVTLQFGLHPVNRALDTFKVYLAVYPARDFLPASGTLEIGDQEATFFSSDKVLTKKEILRSVINIGGVWDVKRLATGYTEASCPMIVDEVRVYAAPAPGAVAATSGTTLSGNNGKLLSSNAIPQRELDLDDILQPVGEGVRTLNVVKGDSFVSLGGRVQFYPELPENTIRANRNTYLAISSDDYENLSAEESISSPIQEFYYVSNVPANGLTMTLDTAFDEESRDNASAASMRIVGYTGFGATALDEDAEFKLLPLGRGDAYQPGVTTIDEATVSEPWFTNVAPLSTNWRIRTYSPLSGATSDFFPEWVRGLVSPRRNPILGMHHINKRVLVTSQGSLFEADDRWRPDGPVDDVWTTSLLIRSKKLPPSNARLPLENDRVVFSNDDNLRISTANLNGKAMVLDAYVRRDDEGLFQTIVWVGEEEGDPQMLPPDFRIHLWTRLRDGFPQLVVGSNANHGGGSRPEQGLFIAEGRQKVPFSRFTHIRWTLFGASSGTILNEPVLQVNGKTVPISLNARESGLSSPNWLNVVNISVPRMTGRVVLGAARHAFKSPRVTTDFTDSVLKGRILHPTNFHGWLHPFGGALSRVAVATAPTITSPPGDFDPREIDYAAFPYDAVLFRADLDEGVGHKCLDSGGSQYGVIHSHPFISLFHQMGREQVRTSFASFGNEVFVANGRKVVVEEEGTARFAGVPAPTAAPSFEVVRNPLWLENISNFDPDDNTDTGVTTFFQDPVGRASVDETERFYHYSTHGNNYLTQTFNSLMAWQRQTDIDPLPTGETRGVVWAFKCYLRMRSVDGRIIVMSQKADSRSGRSLEIRDGKVGIYWWDNNLKREVGYETNQPVVRPGFTTYVYFKKNYPTNHTEGNYIPSIFAEGSYHRITVSNVVGTWAVGDVFATAGSQRGVIQRINRNLSGGKESWDYIATSGSVLSTDTFTRLFPSAGPTADADTDAIQVARDNLVVRQFFKSGSTELTTYRAITGDNVLYSSPRNCIGFGLDGDRRISGTSASGLVTPYPALHTNGIFYTGAALGVVNCNDTVFHDSMHNMLWQWGDTGDVNLTIPGPPGPFGGITYRIIEVVSSTQIKVVLDSDTSVVPDFTAINIASEGGVFSGVALVPINSPDESTAADEGAYDLKLMGDAAQGLPGSGISPFNGEMWCPGWVMGRTHNPATTTFSVFETGGFYGGGLPTDMIERGTDRFDSDVFTFTGTPGPLSFESGLGITFAALDTRKTPYVTTSPNNDLLVAVDSISNAGAADLTWETVDGIRLLDGTKRVWVTFYDPVNDLEGNPSPTLAVTPGGEDTPNLSRDAALRITSLPTRPGFWRRVYMTLTDAFDGFRVAEIRDDTSTSIVILKTENQIADGELILFDRGEPPRSRVIGNSQSRMFYGNLSDQPDGVIPSKPFNPHEVPQSYILSDGSIVPGLFVMDTGDDAEVTGLTNNEGRLIVFKRNAMWGVFADAGIVQQQIISTGIGCVADQSIQSLDNQLYWIDVRGPAFFRGTGEPTYLGTKLEPYFRDTMDPDHFALISAAVNRDRNQYVFTAKRRDSSSTNERFALEFDHETTGSFVNLKGQAVHRLSRYQDPNLTALTEVDARSGGPRMLVGGTEEGFVFWLDRRDVRTMGMSALSAVAGSTSMVAVAGSDRTRIYVAGTIDRALEGARGVRVRWRSGGNDHSAVVLAPAPLGFLLDRRTSLDVTPMDGDAITLGALMHIWRSKHFSFETPEQRKKVYFIDITRAPATGQLYLDVFLDLSTTPYSFSRDRVVDLAVGVQDIDVGEAQFAKFFQFLLRTQADQVGVEFDLFDLNLRLAETESK